MDTGRVFGSRKKDPNEKYLGGKLFFMGTDNENLSFAQLEGQQAPLSNILVAPEFILGLAWRPASLTGKFSEFRTPKRKKLGEVENQ